MDAPRVVRMKASAAKVLAYLRQNRHREVPGWELGRNVCTDYRSRVCELNKLGGIVISKTRIPGDSHKSFQLVLEAQDERRTA